MRGHRDLEIAGGAAAFCALAAPLLPIGWLSLLFALPLALVLPGYAIAAATFARKPVAAPQLTALTVGLSLSVLALGSLLLNYLPGGLSAGWWAAFLALITIAACRGAALRRPGRETRPSTRHRSWRIDPASAVLLLAGAVLASAAIVISFVTFSADKAIGYSELWMQPAGGSRGAGLRIGVRSEEQHRHSYRLQVRSSYRGKAFVVRFALEPGQSKLLRLPVNGPGPVEPRRVVASLFLQGGPQRPYRRVSGWILPPGSRR